VPIDDQGGDGGGGKRGRRADDLLEVSSRQWSNFADADDDSLFFGEKNFAHSRAIKRWLANCANKLSKTAADSVEHQQLSLARRQFEIMDAGIAIARSWRGCAAVEKRNDTFIKLWTSLTTTAQQDPPIVVKCNFLQDLFLQVQVSAFKKSKCYQLLGEDDFKATWSFEYDNLELVEEQQRKYIWLLLATVLCRSLFRS